MRLKDVLFEIKAVHAGGELRRLVANGAILHNGWHVGQGWLDKKLDDGLHEIAVGHSYVYHIKLKNGKIDYSDSFRWKKERLC